MPGRASFLLPDRALLENEINRNQVLRTTGGARETASALSDEIANTRSTPLFSCASAVHSINKRASFSGTELSAIERITGSASPVPLAPVPQMQLSRRQKEVLGQNDAQDAIGSKPQIERDQCRDRYDHRGRGAQSTGVGWLRPLVFPHVHHNDYLQVVVGPKDAVHRHQDRQPDQI